MEVGIGLLGSFESRDRMLKRKNRGDLRRGMFYFVQGRGNWVLVLLRFFEMRSIVQTRKNYSIINAFSKINRNKWRQRL
jgi:hypothetical protein